jgi:hypothetical protein
MPSALAPFPARRLRAALVLASLLASATGFAQTRYWTDLDGHHYDASIVSLYKGEQVTFRHPDGRTFTLDLNDLVANDREAVREWFLKQPAGTGEDPPPTQTLSPFGRPFIIDEPRVLRLLPLLDHGYPSAYLGIPLTVRNLDGGTLDFVNVYFFDDEHKRITFPLPPRGSPLMIQDGKTTSFIKAGDLKPGQTYMVLFPIRDPAVRMATSDLVVTGNGLHMVATVFPDGSWRDFDFPERPIVELDKYADYSGQELYPTQKPSDLFEFTSIARLQPAADSSSNLTATPSAAPTLNADTRDYFRLSLRIFQPFPAAALSAAWYAYDKNHQLLHAEDTPPYKQPGRKDGMFILIQPGSGPADLTDAVTPATGDTFDTVQLPGATWWDKPEVDSLVFVFGTETKKIVRVISKSGATLADLPVPEKAAFGDAQPAPQADIPVRTY